MPVGWKGLFKRLAGSIGSPAAFAPLRSSASLTIKPVLAAPAPDPTDILDRLEMSPDKAAQARSVAEQAVSSIESLLQERQRSYDKREAVLTTAPAQPPTRTPPYSHALSPPPYSGKSYTSPSPSADPSMACLETSAALVTVMAPASEVNTSRSTLRASTADVTLVYYDAAPASPVTMGAFPVAGCTPRSGTPSRIGSLAQIQEDSEAGSQDEAKSRVTHESVDTSEAGDNVQSRLRASWAGRVGRGRKGSDCNEKSEGSVIHTTAVDVEEMDLGVKSSYGCSLSSTCAALIGEAWERNKNVAYTINCLADASTPCTFDL
jgi:hypothetical protein